MDQVELACPFCAGRFRADAAAQSRATKCPNCGRLVTVPAVASVPPPPPGGTPGVFDGRGENAATTSFAKPQDVPPQRVANDAAKSPAAEPRSPFDLAEPTKTVVNRRGEEIPLRRLSPAERERFRRRLNLAFAAIGMAILAIALAMLLRIRP